MPMGDGPSGTSRVATAQTLENNDQADAVERLRGPPAESARECSRPMSRRAGRRGACCRDGAQRNLSSYTSLPAGRFGRRPTSDARRRVTVVLGLFGPTASKHAARGSAIAVADTHGFGRTPPPGGVDHGAFRVDTHRSVGFREGSIPRQRLPAGVGAIGFAHRTAETAPSVSAAGLDSEAGPPSPLAHAPLLRDAS
jgi:hypothetical protein